MYWENHTNQDWLNHIRYYCDYHNQLTADELRDAFIHLSHLYVTDFSNLMLIEDYICQKLGETTIESIFTQTEEGRELTDIDFNNGDISDILGITLRLCDYIENRWFSK